MRCAARHWSPPPPQPFPSLFIRPSHTIPLLFSSRSASHVSPAKLSDSSSASSSTRSTSQAPTHPLPAAAAPCPQRSMHSATHTITHYHHSVITHMQSHIISCCATYFQPPPHARPAGTGSPSPSATLGCSTASFDRVFASLAFKFAYSMLVYVYHRSCMCVKCALSINIMDAVPPL